MIATDRRGWSRRRAPHHVQPVLQTNAFVGLVRELARHHQQHLVQLPQRGLGQREMRAVIG